MAHPKNQLHKLRVITLLAVIIFLFLLVSFLRVFFKDYALRQEISRVQGDVGKLEKRKIESLEVLKRLQSDAYVEDRGRAELQAVKSGEAVLVVPGLTVTSSAPSSLVLTDEKAKPLSNPNKWWYYFFRPDNSQ